MNVYRIMQINLWRHNSYKFSQDLSFLLCFRKSLLRMPFAARKEPFRCSLWVLCASCSSTASGSCLRRIWLRTPTRSSSTWWLRAADVSAYLESYWLAAARASIIKIQTMCYKRNHCFTTLCHSKVWGLIHNSLFLLSVVIPPAPFTSSSFRPRHNNGVLNLCLLSMQRIIRQGTLVLWNSSIEV